MPTENKRAPYGIVGFFAGLLLSYPISYYFQPEALRMKLTMADYLSHIGEIVGDNRLRSAVFMCVIGCSIGGAVIGRFIDGMVGKNEKK